MTGLRGRSALVLGASRGIGAETARRLADSGASVTLVGRDVGLLELVNDSCRAGDHRTLAVDLGSVEGRSRLAEAASNLKFDVVVAATRQRQPWRRITETSAADVMRSMDAHVSHLLDLAHVVLPSQRQGGFGRWVFIGSLVAQIGGRGQAEYVMHKAAVEALSRTIALEEGRYGITANVVAPGFIATEATLGAYDPDAFATLARSNAVERAGTPEEVAHVVDMLCDPRGGFVTGSVLPVGGGVELNWSMGAKQL